MKLIRIKDRLIHIKNCNECPFNNDYFNDLSVISTCQILFKINLAIFETKITNNSTIKNNCPLEDVK